MQYKDELKLKRLIFSALTAMALMTFLICAMGIMEAV